MYRIFSKKVVVAAVIWLALGLVMLGQSLVDLFKFDFKFSSIPLLAWLLLNAVLCNPAWRWFWKKVPKLNEWVFPDLNGVWDVELCSNWPRQAQMLDAAASTEHAIDMRRCAEADLAALTPIKLEAEIHQTWFGFDMLLYNPRGDTPIDRSDTISVDPFPRVGLRRPGICYFYKQVNATDNVADEAEFYGAARLEYDFKKDQLIGLAWTARMWRQAMNTAGAITFTRKSAHSSGQ